MASPAELRRSDLIRPFRPDPNGQLLFVVVV
jgi:hypothetical protein